MDPQNILPQSQPTEFTPPPSRPKLLIPLIFSGIIMLLIGMVGGFYLVKKQTTPSPVSNNSQIVFPSLTPTTIVQDETENWKTYTSIKYGYLIKYPKDWEEKEDTQESTRSHYKELILFNKISVNDKEKRLLPYIGVSISNNKNNLTLDQWLSEKNDTYGVTVSRKDFLTSFTGSSPKNVTIDGIKGYQWISDIDKVTIFEKNKIIYSVSSTIVSPQNTNKSEFGNIYDLVLSSFKFLDNLSINQEKITTYIACGCGCCGGATPNKKCLYYSKGDNLDKIIQEDKRTNQSPQCSTMGCSIGIEYSYCD